MKERHDIERQRIIIRTVLAIWLVADAYSSLCGLLSFRGPQTPFDVGGRVEFLLVPVLLGFPSAFVILGVFELIFGLLGFPTYKNIWSYSIFSIIIVSSGFLQWYFLLRWLAFAEKGRFWTFMFHGSHTIKERGRARD